MFFLGFVQFPYSRGVYLNRLPKANCFSEVSFDSERKGTQSKVACAKSKLAQNIENQWGRSSDIVGSRIHVSSVSRVWFVSIVQFPIILPLFSGLMTQASSLRARWIQLLLFMHHQIQSQWEKRICLSPRSKTLSLFCFTLSGSQAYSHAHFWTSGPGVELWGLIYVYVLWCDG